MSSGEFWILGMNICSLDSMRHLVDSANSPSSLIAIRGTLSDKQADIERLRQQLASATRRQQLASTPQTFLIEQLEAAEVEAKAQATKAEAAARDAADRQVALEASQQQLRMLRADLERLLQQRGSIDALRNTLSRLL